MSSAAGGAPPAGLRPAELLQDTAAAIRDTVDGGPIPNLTWAVVESLTHTRTTKQLGEGGFGEVYKGTGSSAGPSTLVCHMLPTSLCGVCVRIIICAKWVHWWTRRLVF